MIIASERALSDLCGAVRDAPAIFLDTEFISEERYYPVVGTIQLAAGDHVALIDPLAVRDLSPLQELLFSPEIVKVFHAGVQDLGIFYRMFGRPVAPVFDTQVAAAMLGYDAQIAFSGLVERTLKVHLPKSYGFTNWLQRPLSSGQVEYALDDVRYLQRAYAVIIEHLREKCRLDWLREEFSPLEEAQRFQPADAIDVLQRLRGVERMNGRALSVLHAVVEWREETARRLNLPTRRILRDEVLVELARRPRESASDLRGIRGLLPQQIDQFGAEMVEVMRRGATAPPLEIKRPPALRGSLEATVDFLTLCLRSLASEQEISPSLVATRGELAQLVREGDRADVPVMRGWRRQAIGEALLATLQGKAMARIVPDTRRVHLEWHPTAIAEIDCLGTRN